MKIGIVTVLFNSSQVLPDFFASLQRQTLQDFHLWAVDNTSQDDSVSQSRAAGPQVTTIANSTNVGVAAGNNIGIRAALDAGCETVLLLNNDVTFGPDLLQQLYDGLSEQGADMTTPTMYYYDQPNTIWAAGGRFQPWLGYRCYHLHDGTVDVGQFDSPSRVEHAPTCCVLFQGEVFRTVGMMDERYFVYHDDTDFMLRCFKSGLHLVWLPHAHLLHKVSSLTGGATSDFSVRMGTRNRVFMLTKFLGRAAALPYVAAFSLGYRLQAWRGAFSPEVLQVKLKALWTGYRMAKNWLPLSVPRARRRSSTVRAVL